MWTDCLISVESLHGCCVFVQVSLKHFALLMSQLGFSNKSQVSTLGSRTPIKITFREGNSQEWYFQTKFKILKPGGFDFSCIPINTYSKFLEKSKLCNIRGKALDEHLKDLYLFLSPWLGICKKSFSPPPRAISLSCPFFSANFQRLGYTSLCVWASLHPSL